MRTVACSRSWLALTLLATLTLLAALLPGVPAAQASEDLRTRVGFSPGAGLLWLSDAELATELDLAADTGATWLRVDLDWSHVESTQGRYDWARFDRVVQAAQSRGLRVLALPTYTPSWARPPGTSSHHPPVDPRAFAAFVGAAVDRYAPRGVRAWEVWNEPNIPTFWEPAADASAYATLLRHAAAAIRAADPGASIVTGGLAPAYTDTSRGSVSPVDFVRELYALGVRDSFTAVGVHPYSFPYMPLTPNTEQWNTFQQLPLVHEVMARAGDSGKRVWLTEIGAPTGTARDAVSPERQAAILDEAIRAAAEWSWTGPILVYSIRDSGSDPADREQNFGVVARDGTRKPAWHTLRVLLAEGSSSLVPPSGVIARGGRGVIYLRWSGASGATGYLVERSLDPTSLPERRWVQVGVLPASARSLVDQDVRRGQRYHYRVRSRVEDHTSAPSTEVVTQLNLRRRIFGSSLV